MTSIIDYLGLNWYSDWRNHKSSILIEYKQFLLPFENNIVSDIADNGDIFCQ